MEGLRDYVLEIVETSPSPRVRYRMRRLVRRLDAAERAIELVRPALRRLREAQRLESDRAYYREQLARWHGRPAAHRDERECVALVCALKAATRQQTALEQRLRPAESLALEMIRRTPPGPQHEASQFGEPLEATEHRLS